MKVLGWDIGGAHLKAALCVRGRVTRVWLRPCALWRDLAALHENMRALCAEAGVVDAHAATMTGELADVFTDRREGVRALVQALEETVAPAPLRIYAHPRRWLSARQARTRVAAVASANWSVSAAWLARCIDEALFVDMGSTTTDLLALCRGVPVSRGVTDAQRLACDELVYTGVVRTPVMSLAAEIPFAGAWHAPMAEVFATSADVYRVLGRLPADADRMPSADGRGKSRLESARRLGRMIGIDVTRTEQMRDCAAWLAQSQLWRLERAARLVLSAVPLPPRAPLVGAGVGRFVTRDLAARLGRPWRDMASFIPAAPGARAAASDCAPAACVALLAARGD